MWVILLAFVVHIFVQPVKCDISSNRTCVTTPLGKIEGYYELSWKNRPYKCFTRIPYAKPPTGELRFEPPVPIEKWHKPIEAFFKTPLCAQWDRTKKTVVGEEDCLFLNIFVPVLNRTENVRLPVLFFIHGGGFQGENSWKQKPKYLMDRDAIVVIVSYRLSLFGFLSTEDDVIPGNMGLKDQSLALRWVADNIKYFQGDPKRVTLAGVSAGGISVQYHYLSPMSSGLFHAGISASGTVLNPWSLINESSSITAKLAVASKCPMDNSTIIKECLKTKSTKTLLDAAEEVTNNLEKAHSYIIFLPVVENIKKGYFINKAPIDIIKSGKISDVPWVTGVVTYDGLALIAGIYTNETAISYYNKNWETAGAPKLWLQLYAPKKNWPYILHSAKQHYLGNEPISTEKNAMIKFTRLIGDYTISVHEVRAAKLQATVNKSPVYFYYYTYEAVYTGNPVGPNRDIKVGVGHGDDVSFLFASNGVDPTTTENDKAKLEEVLDNWYSIIATGKPNLGVPWPAVGSAKDFQYMHIGGPKDNQVEVDNNFAEIKFWTSLGI